MRRNDTKWFNNEYLYDILGTLLIEDDVCINSFGKEIKFIVKIPFPLEHTALNALYFKFALLLEENTNRLMAEKNVFATRDYIYTYSGLGLSRFAHVIKQFKNKGILVELDVNKTKSYIMNPYFAFCGDKIPLYLTKIFEDDRDNIIGYRLFNSIFKGVTSIDKIRKLMMENKNGKI